MTAIADPYPLEMLGVDGIVWQEARGHQEFYIPDERDDLLEIVEYPSLGRHIDEVQIDVHTVGRAAVLSVSSTLQEYIDGACSMSCPLWPTIERGASFYRQFPLVDRAEQWELITG